MATLAEIYDWFMTGKKPTQAQFWASWGSTRLKGEPIPQSDVTNLTTVLNAKAEKTQFDAHKIALDAHPQLLVKARIIPVGQMQVFKIKAPDDEGYQEGKQEGDYCIGIVENKFIQGTYIGPGDDLESYELDTSINL